MLDRAEGEDKRRRRSVSLSLPAALVDEADALGLDLSQVVEEGLVEAVQTEKARRWREENRPAIEEQNEFHRRHGFWAEQHRPW
jgi:antitoxin CcdA